MLKYKITIQIDNIQVDEGYYSFDWMARIGTKKHTGSYDDSYEGHTKRGMRQVLEEGYALEIVLVKIGEGN